MDWIAGIIELTALYLVGCKQKIGFLIGTVCNVLWVIYVLYTRSTYGLLPVVCMAFILNIINYFKWRKVELLHESSSR